MDALPGLILPHRGQWCVADMQPLALDVCEDIRLVHGFLPDVCGFLPESLSLAWVGTAADVRIPLIESISWSVMRRVSAPGYMLSSMLALLFVK
jgi:hypothetical protein